MKLDRLLIESVENRILVGITMFVGIMVIVGWIGINEPARMATFQDQFEGRSIERGAYLFNQNCATCHGIDGLGLTGRAPGLNNPHMFGYDYLSTQRRQIEDLELRLANLTNNDGSAAEIAEIENQIAAVEEEIAGVVAQMQPAIDRGYDPDNTRLSQVSWEGSLESYVYTTLVHGRPGSANVWPASGGGMAAWGQVAGGPLRDDQLQDLTNYILNWDKGNNWTMDNLLAVNQFGIIAVDSSAVTVSADGETIGTDVDAILVELENYTGDPVNGQTIYNGAYACAGCHANEVVAPLTELTWIAATNGEGGRPYAGEPARYVVESVVNPGAYVVTGYPAGAMPGNFAERITYQEMADILAYLRSYD